MRTVLVVGAGTMGRGIAQVALVAGHEVVLCDTDPDQLEAAVQDILGRIRRKDPAAADVAARRLVTASSVALAPHLVDPLVIEAVVERLEAKVSVFSAALERFGEGSVLATNTSSLSVTAIASGVAAPDRVVGMHFFNPVPVMRLVEVVSGLQTDPSLAHEVAETARAWGKDVALVRSAPGFIVNRVARAFYGEALRLVEEGAATSACIDEVMRGAGGFRMGPFELMDLIGVEVNDAVTRTVWQSYNFEPRFAPSPLQAELVAAGRLGRKSGHGFYRYAEDSERPRPKALVPGAAAVSAPVVNGTNPQLTVLAERAHLARGTGDDSLLDFGPLGLAVITQGLSAAQESQAHGREVVVIDRALDPATATAWALAGHDDQLLAAVAVVLRDAGVEAYRVDDTPGLVVSRILSMIANEACEAEQQGIATAEDIDTAMVLATNYPSGPFSWLRSWGPVTVRDILDNVWATYRDPRYRCSRRLRVLAGS